MEPTCLTCGKGFVPSNPHRAAKYCSRGCYYKSRIGHPPTNPLRRITITCATCGKGFEAGGRSGRQRTSKYCSRECSHTGTIRHPPPNDLKPLDAAYLAGFFDGEGSIIRVKGHGWRITIYQSDEAVIRWIAEIVGTGMVAQRFARSSNLVKQPLTTRSQWYWNLYGRNAAALLRQLLPHLKVKTQRAAEMLADF